MFYYLPIDYIPGMSQGYGLTLDARLAEQPYTYTVTAISSIHITAIGALLPLKPEVEVLYYNGSLPCVECAPVLDLDAPRPLLVIVRRTDRRLFVLTKTAEREWKTLGLEALSEELKSEATEILVEPKHTPELSGYDAYCCLEADDGSVFHYLIRADCPAEFDAANAQFDERALAEALLQAHRTLAEEKQKVAALKRDLERRKEAEGLRQEILALRKQASDMLGESTS